MGKNILVVGGSYVGAKVVDFLAPLVHETHNIVLIEKNSHFQHLFAYPRMSVIPSYEHRAYIPYTAAFFKAVDNVEDWPGSNRQRIKPSSAIQIHRGVVTSIEPTRVILENDATIPYEYLVLATGTGQPPSLEAPDKKTGIRVAQALQERVKDATRIVVVGGGAYGVQVVTDIKTYLPTKDKHVTLIHSRECLLNRYNAALHSIVMQRCQELGIDVILNNRIVVPPGGFSEAKGEFEIQLTGGGSIKADFVLLCTGSVPLSDPLQSLCPESIDPVTRYIKVKSTLQIDSAIPHDNVFAVGDVADTRAQKTARPGYVQAGVVARNIDRLIKQRHIKVVANGNAKTQEKVEDEPLENYKPGVGGIHLSLGLDKGVIFQNTQPDGEGPPAIKHEETNSQDLTALMSYARWWKMRADGIEDYFS